jgi:hypothetical protein
VDCIAGGLQELQSVAQIKPEVCIFYYSFTCIALQTLSEYCVAHVWGSDGDRPAIREAGIDWTRSAPALYYALDFVPNSILVLQPPSHPALAHHLQLISSHSDGEKTYASC